MISLYISYLLYRALIAPLELMKTGVDAIVSQDFNVRFLETGSREVDSLIGVFNQMIDKLRGERVRTQEQAYFLENLLANSPVGMIILDYDGLIASVNERAKEYLNVTRDLEGEQIEALNHPLAAFITQLEMGQSEIYGQNGAEQYRCMVRQVFHKGFYRRFVVVEELSAEMMRSERIAYGKIIRMMAHEVNNSTGAINSIMQSVIDFGLTDERDADLRESMEVAQDRNKALGEFVDRFAEVVRLPAPTLQRIDLVEIVRRSLAVMQGALSEAHVEVNLSGDESPVWLSLDRTQMEQVIINIIKNAIESIGENGNIQITLSLRAPQLTIADNGAGIAAEDESMLFTPFFSTKPTGQGVGLMMIREILSAHDARYSLSTGEDGWTRFVIAF